MNSDDGEIGAHPQGSQREMSGVDFVNSDSAPFIGQTCAAPESSRHVKSVVKETESVLHTRSGRDSNADNFTSLEQSIGDETAATLLATSSVQTSASDIISKATAPLATAESIDADTLSASQIIADNTLADQDASMEYDVDDDGGVIRCICECDDDDGFTIQCDKCLVWQHCACFGMSQASVPDEYHCEQCDPRPVNVEFAKAHQQRRREAELKKASMERSARRQNSANAAAVVMYNESMVYDTSMDALQQVDGSKGNSTMISPGGINRSRKPSQQLDLTNVTFASVEGPPSASATPGSSKANRKKGSALKSGGGGKRSSAGETQGMGATTPRVASLLAGGNASLSSPATFRNAGEDRADLDDLLDKVEAWQVEYTPITQNLVTEQSITDMLTAMLADQAHLRILKADRGTGNRIIAPVLGKRVKTLVNLNAIDDAGKSHDQDASNLINDAKEEEIGLTAIGDECIPVELPISDLAICTQRTYVKQISELAAASIFNSLLQINPLPSEPQRPWSASRTFNKPVMHGLFADVSIPAGCFVQEYIGELCSADTYRRDPINQYYQIGASKPNVHLFPPPLDLCIDARRYSNTSRFARFSCHPNAVIRPIVLIDGGNSHAEDYDVLSSRQSATHHRDEIKFGLFAISDIPRTHEITLGWEWDDAHVVHILPQLVRNPLLGVLDASPASLPTSTRGGNQRVLERERRHAAVTVLVEKGDFPYSGTTFSQKMNSVLTVLLSSCLCACIGSASASNGTFGNSGGTSNNSASSNNMKRQDCAISQMLRLSQGMTLLNVHIPGSSQATGKSNRKSKAPDFEPLVGKRRWWRPDAMPLTPRSSEARDGDSSSLALKDDYYRDLDVPYKITPDGRVGRVEEWEFEKAMKREEISARVKNLRQDMDVIGKEESEDGEESDDASSVLTEPLPRDSDQEDGENDDEEGDDSLLLDGNNVTIAKDDKGASFLTRTALPPKKRVSGTRLKAVVSGEENSDVEYKGKRKRHSDGKPRSMRDEGRDSNLKKRRKKKRSHEQSSPLTSAPSDVQSGSEESDDSLQEVTPTPMSKKVTSNRSETSKRSGRVSEEGKENAEKNRKAEFKAKKKKALIIKRRRKELLGDFDEEASDISADAQLNDTSTHDEHPIMSSPVKAPARTKNASKMIVYSDDEEEEGSVSEGMVAQVGLDAIGSKDEEIPSVSTLDDAKIAEELPTVAPPPPPIEVPKAKLSLADYKKRLAERRTTSANSQGNITTPLTTPSLLVQSPEKTSQPNTPLSNLGATAGFAFPTPVSSALPSPSVDVVMTPTIPTPRAEFAPPPPRFPRPMTPPRSMKGSDLAPVVGSSIQNNLTPGLVDAAEIAKTPQQSPSTSAINVPPVDVSVNVPIDASTVTPSENATARVDGAAFAPHFTAPIKSERVIEDIPYVSDTKIIIAQPLTASETSSALRPRNSSVSAAAVPLPFDSSGSSITSPSTNIIAITSTTTTNTTFNPPKAPRAFTNSSALPAGSPPPSAPQSLAAATTAASPPMTQYDHRQARTSLSYEGLHPPTSYRNPSPTRPPIASPVSSYGGSYSSQIAGQSALSDFANVPKGPARMRDREGQRDLRGRDIEEREFREPLPPLRDRERDREREWEWERERERERLERERERDYALREASYHSDPYRDRDRDREWDREYPYDRRRLEEEEEERLREYNAVRQPSAIPFPARGGARGGYQGTVRGGAPAWSGRARTRGRGSRGGGGATWR